MKEELKNFLRGETQGSYVFSIIFMIFLEFKFLYDMLRLNLVLIFKLCEQTGVITNKFNLFHRHWSGGSILRLFDASITTKERKEVNFFNQILIIQLAFTHKVKLREITYKMQLNPRVEEYFFKSHELAGCGISKEKTYKNGYIKKWPLVFPPHNPS